MSQVSNLISEIRHVDRKFRRARQQILILNERIEGLLVRYRRSEQDGRRSFKCSERLQVATVEGVRNMYFEYARRQCEIMDDLQDALKTLTGEEYDAFDDFE